MFRIRLGDFRKKEKQMITNLDFFIEQWIPNNIVTLSSKAVWLLVVNSSSASHLITTDQKNVPYTS